MEGNNTEGMEGDDAVKGEKLAPGGRIIPLIEFLFSKRRIHVSQKQSKYGGIPRSLSLHVFATHDN